MYTYTAVSTTENWIIGNWVGEVHFRACALFTDGDETTYGFGRDVL